MTTTATGRKAETIAAAYLQRQGCEIIQQNWRTRWCEIDVVALRNNTLYFCEVKYRSTAYQGRGLDYITPAKLKQMYFAAQNWIHAHHWQGDSQLCAIEVSGPRFQITAVAKDL